MPTSRSGPRPSASRARGPRRLLAAARHALPAAVLCLIFAAAPAQARSPLEPELVVQANAKTSIVSLELHSVPGASCRLRVSDDGWARSFDQNRIGPSGIRSWRFSVPSGLNTAPWTFYARCERGRSYGWHRLVAEMGFPELGGALVQGMADGSAPGTSCDEQGLCFADDPLSTGQCGWYALGRRPELLPYVEHSQHAGEWLAGAEGHLPEGSTPRVGALAVWSIASDPPNGHVGYVAAVSGAQVLIDDSNWRPTPQSPDLQVHEHWVGRSQPAGYIYEP